MQLSTGDILATAADNVQMETMRKWYAHDPDVEIVKRTGRWGTSTAEIKGEEKGD